MNLYVFISACNYKLARYIYIGIGSSSTKPTCYTATLAQNGQISRGSSAFCVFTSESINLDDKEKKRKKFFLLLLVYPFTGAG